MCVMALVVVKSVKKKEGKGKEGGRSWLGRGWMVLGWDGGGECEGGGDGERRYTKCGAVVIGMSRWTIVLFSLCVSL
jgi:hypothetical protein